MDSWDPEGEKPAQERMLEKMMEQMESGGPKTPVLIFPPADDGPVHAVPLGPISTPALITDHGTHRTVMIPIREGGTFDTSATVIQIVEALRGEAIDVTDLPEGYGNRPLLGGVSLG